MIKYDVPLNLEANDNLHKLAKRIKPNSTILEFGPSTGRLTRFLKEERRCRVYGVEIDAEAFSISKAYMADGICDDIETYTWVERFQGLQFDYIIFADVLEHLRNPKNVIEVLKPFLKEQGEVLASVPNIAHNAIIIELLANRFNYNATGLLDNTHIHFFTLETCNKMFMECGYHPAYSDGTVAEPYNTEIQNSVNGLPREVADYLNTRNYGNLYQMIFAFRLQPCVHDNQLKQCRQRDYFAKVYLDDGNGFHEENLLLKEVRIDDGIQTIVIKKEDLHQATKKIGIIPIANFIAKCKTLHVLKDGRPCTYKIAPEAVQYEDAYFFDQEKIMIDTTNMKEVTIQYQIEIGAREDYTLGLLQNQKKLKSAIKNIIKSKHQNKKQKQTCSIALLNIESKEITPPTSSFRIEQYQGFIECVTQDYVCLRFHDAKLNDTYFNQMKEVQNATGADLLFSDCLGMNGEPLYKTDFSYEGLISQTQEYDVIFLTAVLYNQCQKDLQGKKISSSHEFMLHVEMYAKEIQHVSEPIYQIQTPIDEFHEHSLEMVKQSAIMKYGDSVNHVDLIDAHHCSVRFRLDPKTSKVTIVIPMKDKWELSDACVKSILEQSTYPNYEILILDNNSEEEETFGWLQTIEKQKNVRSIKATFEFNWSKLNNFGIANSDADVFIFLNNDTLVISPDWIEKMVEDATRNDSGITGALLVYDDDTIQHAGVVVGLNDFADHIYKQETLSYTTSLFPSPLDKRNILAVTGACMGISRKTLQTIGGFDESFIICGSDVEICIRAYKHGMKNIYDPYIKLYHLESKSRDSYIPPIDFEMSIKHYAPYREQGDPYFNKNLSKRHTTPKKGGK